MASVPRFFWFVGDVMRCQMCKVAGVGFQATERKEGVYNGGMVLE
jgi:hypothetical protein